MNKLNCISVDEQNTVFRERKQKQKPKPCDGRKEGRTAGDCAERRGG